MTATTMHFEGTEQVFPCRCGETHRGDYAAYDYGHHNCFHDAELLLIEDGYLICPDCGKTFSCGAGLSGEPGPGTSGAGSGGSTAVSPAGEAHSPHEGSPGRGDA